MAKLLRALSVNIGVNIILSIAILLTNCGSISAEPQTSTAQTATAPSKQSLNKKKAPNKKAYNKQKVKKQYKHKKDYQNKNLGKKKGAMPQNKEKSELEIMADSLRTDSYTGYTKLMDALVKKMPFNMVRYLVEVKKENVNEVDSEMLRHVKPVLRYAIDRGTDAESVAIINYLIEQGARLNEKTYNRTYNDATGKENKIVYGFMPLLTYAVIYSSPEVVQLLVDKGADLNKIGGKDKTDNPHTPLCLAYQLGKKEVVEILKKAGAKEMRCSWWRHSVYKVRSWFR